MEPKSNLQKKLSKIKKQSARAVMNQKTSNSIIAVNKEPKVDVNEEKPIKSYHEEYFVDLFSCAKIPVSDEYIQKCATEWLHMVRDEEVLRMDSYMARKGIPNKTWERWIERSPELREAREMVRTLIAIRREEGGLKNKYSAQWGLKMQHFYDKDWKEGEEWRAKLVPKDTISTQPIQVILEKFPDSALVPVKKQTEE